MIEVKSRPEIKRYPCKVLKEATGEDISTRAMMEYFKAVDELARGTKQRPPRSAGNEALVPARVPSLLSRRAV